MKDQEKKKKRKKEKKKDNHENEIVAEDVNEKVVADEVIPDGDQAVPLNEEELEAAREAEAQRQIEIQKENEEIRERERQEEIELQNKERRREERKRKDKEYKIFPCGTGFKTELDKHRDTMLYFENKKDLHDYIENTKDGQELYNINKRMEFYKRDVR